MVVVIDREGVVRKWIGNETTDHNIAVVALWRCRNVLRAGGSLKEKVSVLLSA